MPGYKALPQQFHGAAAEQVRVAEVMLRSGDPTEAVRILEATLEVCAAETPVLPGWLCGRLAALYRTVERYDDEVRLLERYRESQSSEEARARFDARLSKARAIAERKRRPEICALSSVRRVMAGHGEAHRPPHVVPAPHDASLSSHSRERLRSALIARAHARDRAAMTAALREVCAEAHARDLAPEQLVLVIKSVWRGTTPPGLVGVLDWDGIYREVLTMALATYFENRP